MPIRVFNARQYIMAVLEVKERGTLMWNDASDVSEGLLG